MQASSDHPKPFGGATLGVSTGKDGARFGQGSMERCCEKGSNDWVEPTPENPREINHEKILLWIKKYSASGRTGVIAFCPLFRLLRNNNEKKCCGHRQCSSDGKSGS